MKTSTTQNLVVNGDVFRRQIETVVDQDTRAITLFHSNGAGNSIGGIRIVESGTLEEVAHLSKAMTAKCKLAGIPATGQKTIISLPRDQLVDENRKTQILKAHLVAAVGIEPDGIWGPDMNCPESVLDRLVTECPEVGKNLTGLSESAGGFGIDTQGFTAIGIVEAIDHVIDFSGLRLSSVGIQGFGAVGAHCGRLIEQRGLRVKAISNACGTIWSDNGLPAGELFDVWNNGGDQAVIEFATSASVKGVHVSSDPNQLYEATFDIFIPAARTSVIATCGELAAVRIENPNVISVEEFLSKTKTRLIAEAANHPISTAAEAILEQSGVIVLPDFVINSGGLIGCWLEHEARKLNRKLPPINKALHEVQCRVRHALRSLWLRPGVRQAAVELVNSRLFPQSQV